MRVHNMLEVRLYAKALEESRAEIRRLFDQVVAERKISERLAFHAPPGSIAARLDKRPDVTEDSFADVTVLIADVVGFAELTPALGADRLAPMLEEIFALFDRLAIERGVKKIKTLGNSYMAVCGVPTPSEDHAVRAAHFALDMIAGLGRFDERHGSRLQVRIGIHSGDVVAGVIGRRLFVYDVWGDAVNIAARMESHGVAGRVQVSESTRLLLAEPFVLEERGREINTWFLAGRNGVRQP